MSNLRRRFKNKFEQKQNVPYTIAGLLGNTTGVVKVPGRNSYVYVRLAGAGVAEVFNNRVNTIFDLPVICGYDPVDPQRFQVLSLQGSTVDAVGSSLNFATGYAPSERYRWMYPSGGQDPLFSELRQWMPLRISISGPMKFVVHNQIIWNGTAWITFGGSTETDLTSLIPTTSGKCCMVLISINESGVLVTTKGTEVNIADLVPANIPAPPTGTRYVLGAIRLYYGQTFIQEARTNTDVSDLRFPQIGGAVSTLTDADLTGIADNDVLVYNNSSGIWYPEALVAGTSLDVTEVDGIPNVSGVSKLIFPNDSLTNNLDGSVSVVYPSPYSLLVREIDGTPSVSGVDTINITNGTLTDNGTGSITIDFGSASTDGDAIHDNESNEISAITEKTTPHNDDIFLIEDSEASYVKKKVKASNLPSGGSTSLDGWIATTSQPTYVSATSIQFASADLTSYFPVGTKIKLTQTTVKYFYVTASAYSGGNTTLTLTAGNVYTVANAAITLFNYAHGVAWGFPEWFNWTPTLNEGTTDLSGFTSARFTIHGRTLSFTFEASNVSTSGAGQIYIGLPVAPSATQTPIHLFGKYYLYNATVGYGMTNCLLSASQQFFVILKNTFNLAWVGNETGLYFYVNGSYEI